MKHTIIALVIAMGATACKQWEGEKPQTLHQYFDVARLVKEQIALLSQQRAKVRKTAQGELATAGATEVDWQQELSIFLEGDINKPVLQDLYVVAQDHQQISYAAIDKKLKVQALTVVGSPQQPQQVLITLQEDNLLYSTAKQLTLTFSGNRLKSYQVIGYQKVILNDTLQYNVLGQVVE